jgi:hypothetical protein
LREEREEMEGEGRRGREREEWKGSKKVFG